MDVHDRQASDRSSSEYDNLTEGNSQQTHQEMDARRCAAINDETRAAIENASALTERAAIELADLERRIAEFKDRLRQERR